MTAEERVAAARAWFEECSQAKSVPSGLAPWVEPEPAVPVDLRHVDPIVMSLAISLHRCSNCDRGIHVGHPVVSYRPLATHHFTLHFHESCVILR